MSDTDNVEGYVGTLKVVELRDQLKKRNLSPVGNKSVLAQRLQEFLQKEKEGKEKENEEETTEQQPGEVPEQAEGGNDASAEPEVSQEVAQGGGESGAAPEQEEYEVVMDQVVQTEATGDTVDKVAAQQLAQEPEVVPSEQQVAEVVPSEQQVPEVVPSEQQVTEGEEVTEEEVTGDEVVETPCPDVDQPALVADETSEQEGGKGEEPVDGESLQEMVVEDSIEGTQLEGETDEMVTEDQSAAQPKPEEECKQDGQAETSTTDREERGKGEGYSRGTKRSREEDGERGGRRPDPTRAPDPEEPEEFDEGEAGTLMGEEFRPPEDDSIVVLDRFNSDLHFTIRGDGLGGCGLAEQGFANLWAAARATWGLTGGKYFYEVKVEKNVEVDLPDTEEHPNALRVGWSVDEAGLGLGEAALSFGYGGTGKVVVNNRYNEYGEKYGPGDIIGCYLDLESTPGTISFSKNGSYFGTAFVLDEDVQGKVLYPHVATKNVVLSLNFKMPAWCDTPDVDGYTLLQGATEEHKKRAPKGPEKPGDCEVLMMIGLPAAGKTTWAEKHCRQNPEKQYTILGTNLIMDKMKVSGLARKYNYHGRWEQLIKQATDVLNRMFVLASKNPRNYIIDQTNVYASAQRRKLKYFEGFVTKAIVVIPPHHELRKRTARRTEEMGFPVPDDAINAMKANFHIPRAGAGFEEVIYSEIYGPAAEKIVRQYRDDALGLPSYPSNKRGRYESGGGRGGRYGPPPSRPYSPYRPYYSPYGYGRPSYPPYGPPPPPPPPPPMYGHPHPRGGYRPRNPYSGRQYGYGPPPPSQYPPRGGGYYGRY